MIENKNNTPSAKPEKSKKKKKKNGFKVFKIILLSLLVICVLIGVAAGGLALAVIKTAPDLDINEIIAASEASKIYDDKGNYVDSIITPHKKTVIKYEDMPKNLINAFVSIEDERFFKHKGIDLKRIAGVTLTHIKNTLQGKSALEGGGGSTITQQLLKTTLYEFQNETFAQKIKRKVQEWYLAPKLEKKVGKKAILEAYLNTIFLGGRAIGVEAAAQQYFGTSAKNLNLIQCAFIAGLTQSPSVYYPYSKTSTKDPSKYINRTKTVLSKMKENGYISDKEYEDAIAELNIEKSSVTQDKDVQTLGKTVLGRATSKDDRYNFEWFSRAVVSDVKKDLKEVYNYTDDEIENLLMNGNLKIYSTMNKDLQTKAQQILDEDSKLNSFSRTDKNNIVHPQASLVITDYHTGEVKVIIGGRGKQPAMSYNRALDAKVPPGSSIKPLTVYAPAIDTKLATAATVIEDSPLSPELANKYGSNGKPWQPKNSNGVYSGYLNMRNAIKDSVNLYAIKLEDMIGLDTGVRYGEKFGIKFDDADKHSIAALALGELSYGTNTFTMANAYGVFGNNGLYTEPRLYTRVVDRTGNTILETKIETRKVISPQAAYIMYDLLKEPVRGGTAYRANDSYTSDIPLAGKTGSSTNFKNVWFSGLTPYYSGSIWIENKYQQAIYSSHAAYLFGKIMNEAVKDLPVKDITPPSGITSSAVDRVSGLLPSELSYRDPRGSQVYTELFIKGTVPTTVDNIHVEALVNKFNGKLATPFTPSSLTESRVFIRRDYIPSVPLADQQYVLPRSEDNSTQYSTDKLENEVPDDDLIDEDLEDTDDEEDEKNIGDDTDNFKGNSNNEKNDRPVNNTNDFISKFKNKNND
ncbi:transglycosylase domain-containing protein [Clostridium colicanis]|uniref:Penicillin-binding protein 1A n=1 Tax=Clostridium colicanis DSM 13634 TaxID=1121305 RepID=A0A151AR63_9CLOT|nr:transglycosylase domain-containing protein [Clostridium colicanis]KYH30129.1 penicillin-binding protein 1A/1B [Clostridium colicanis DSM 13634]